MLLLLESSFHSRGRRADLRNGGWFRALWVKSFWQKETEGLKIWSDFFFIPFFGFLWIIRCTAIVWLVTSWLKQLGWMWERRGGGVCWLATIEVILSYVHVSLLLNAVFSKWEFLWSWNVKWSRKLKTQMSPFFFFLSSSSKVAAFSQLRPVKSHSCSAYAQQVTGIHRFNSYKCSHKVWVVTRLW